jgi:hypothetical protein
LSSSSFFDTFDWFELKEQTLEPPYQPYANTIEEKLHISESFSKMAPAYTGEQDIFKDFGNF